MSTNEKEDAVPVQDVEHDLEDKAMTRRVLWKLDLHVLPPLALVSAPTLCETCNGLTSFRLFEAMACELHCKTKHELNLQTLTSPSHMRLFTIGQNQYW